MTNDYFVSRYYTYAGFLFTLLMKIKWYLTGYKSQLDKKQAQKILIWLTL